MVSGPLSLCSTPLSGLSSVNSGCLHLQHLASATHHESTRLHLSCPLPAVGSSSGTSLVMSFDLGSSHWCPFSQRPLFLLADVQCLPSYYFIYFAPHSPPPRPLFFFGCFRWEGKSEFLLLGIGRSRNLAFTLILVVF